MNHSLSKSTAYNSKNLIHNCIGDLGCADCGSQVRLNLNHRPANSLQQKLQLSHELANYVSLSDFLGCGSEVCLNFYHLLATAVATPAIHERCLMFWSRCCISVRLSSLPTGMGNYTLLNLSYWESQSLPKTFWCTWTSILCQKKLLHWH